MPRFPVVTYTPANPMAISDSSVLISPTITAIQTQVASICAGTATAWINALRVGLDTIHATAGKIDTLTNALISICSAGGDLSHPLGASTLPPGGTGPYASFAAAIKSILLGGGNYTTLINPWLIDSPNPYTVPQQAVTQTITNSNTYICALLAHIDSLATDELASARDIGAIGKGGGERRLMDVRLDIYVQKGYDVKVLDNVIEHANDVKVKINVIQQ